VDAERASAELSWPMETLNISGHIFQGVDNQLAP
jgi:hypothetical protein